MEKNPRILIAATIIVSLLYLACGVAVAAWRTDESSPCNGSSVAEECSVDAGEMEEDDEVLMMMESLVSQRFMRESRRISYGALRPNQPACGGGGRGNSYSGSCLPPRSNPHSRGCAKYYRCRSDS